MVFGLIIAPAAESCRNEHRQKHKDAKDKDGSGLPAGAALVFVALLVPSAAPLCASLMFGNLLKECGVTERLSKTVQNELMNIVTVFLGISVGATATGSSFLKPKSRHS